MIEALTRTLWGVRRAAADGVPTEQRLEAIAAGEAAIDRLDAEGSQILDGVLRPCASVADEAAAAITLLIAALTAMQERR